MSYLPVSSCRDCFPMLKKSMHGNPLIYLDSAATTQKPQSVIDAIASFYTDQYATVHRAVYEIAAQATLMYDLSRQTVQKFIHAEHFDEVIFTRGTTESINLVATCFSKAFIQSGDEILISETEHHSNIVPWQMVCEEKGAVLKVIPSNSHGEIDLDQFKQFLSEKTKIVAIAHVSNVTGTIHPIKQMIAIAHEKGIPVLIDGAQSISHMTVDVQDLDADFYVFSGHKAYGPTGIGVLYGKRRWLEKMPPYHGGGDMVDRVDFNRTTYQKAPLKFEAGTPLIAEVIGLGAAVDFIDSIGRERIAAWESELLHYATQKMQAIQGLSIIGQSLNKGPIATFSIEGIHPLDLGTMLSLKGVAIRTGHMCAQPTMKKYGHTALSRISFGVYNQIEEIDQFMQILQETLLLLRPSLSY
ncbi:MAG: SufS family cysteine desulfurase [Chlamydiia bacterium]|nr:SufS family cysteine desulfurase [Chlamydiia bacterium]